MYVGICEEEEKGKEKEMRVVYEGGFGYYQPNFNVSPILTSARSWRDINGYGRSLCFRHFFFTCTLFLLWIAKLPILFYKHAYLLLMLSKIETNTI